MLKNKIIYILLLISSIQLKAQELELFKDMEGYWQFSVGDNESWKEENFNDTDWDEIYVPNRWEDEGYNEYNGFAWYRKSFKVNDIKDCPIWLILGKIDDVDEVFINGKKVGQTGEFYPEYITGYNQERRYKIPSDYLKINSQNIIAVRVYDEGWYGGIVEGNIGLYYDMTEELIELNLEGEWSFALSEPTDNINPKLSELDWTKINVPAKWEDEGFENYNGYAVYMKTFNISSELAEKDLMLLLGKIDDYDYVYFNSKLIGKVFDLKKQGAYFGKGNEYSALRAYKIPRELIKADTKNTIVVKVYDYFKDGGIYEGPVGITTQEKFKYFEKKYYGNKSLWDLITN